MLAPSHPAAERRLAVGSLAMFAVVAVVAAVDLLTDMGGGVTVQHIVIEGTLVAAGLGGVSLMARRLLVSRQQALHRSRLLSEQLEVAQREAHRYRQEAQALLQGLGEVIDRELDRWELTPAEKEVALLLLKGLSHKEIATARKVSEATARQQAGAVYRKAGVAGRNELSAYFLEDLMLPMATADGRDPSGRGSTGDRCDGSV